MKAWLQRTFRFVLIWFKQKPAPPSHNYEPIQTLPNPDPMQPPPFPIGGSIGERQPIKVEITEQPKPPEPEPEPKPHPQGNRTMRRRINALERARRKHDKFITPQGTPPTPKHIERQPQPENEPKPPVIVLPEVPTKEFFCVDKHHTGGGEDVLYKEAEFYGEYNFRDTILDQLDRYFIYLRRMKKNDPGSYALYKQVGAILLPYIDIHPDLATNKPDRKRHKPHTTMPKLSAWFKKNRPGFGCFVYGANPVAEKFELGESEKEKLKKTGKWITVPKFMYFNKYSKPPPEVQPMSGGDVYCMSVWWDRPHDPSYKRKAGGQTEYAVFISADGEEIQILRMCKTKYIDVLAKKHKKDNFYFKIPQRCWQIPKTFKDWADDFHEDVQIHLADIFVEAMHRYEQSQYSMIRIAAKKDDMTAVFSVNVKRMAYFFKDRDYVLTENGTRKPVFHMVRAHERETVTGKHAVKFHFRGEREFTWAGYQISITVPGRDHFMLSEFDIGTVDEYWIDKKEMKDYMMPDQVGKMIVDGIESGLGGKGPR